MNDADRTERGLIKAQSTTEDTGGHERGQTTTRRKLLSKRDRSKASPRGVVVGRELRANEWQMAPDLYECAWIVGQWLRANYKYCTETPDFNGIFRLNIMLNKTALRAVKTSSNNVTFYEPLEEAFFTGMLVITVIGVVLICLSTWLVARYTPKEMSSYRYTSTNCTVWMLPSTLVFTFVCRPVVISPLPIAVITGAIPSPYALFVGLTLCMNLSVALTLCLGTQCLCITFPLLYRRIGFLRGVTIFVACHVVVTILIVSLCVYLTISGVSQDVLRAAVLREFPELSVVVQSRTLVGCDPENCPTVVAPFNIAWSCLLASLWTFMLVSTFRNVIFKIRRSTPEKTQRFRRTMALMLTTRTVVPLLSLALPAILAFTLSTIGVAGLSGFYVALALFAASTGQMIIIVVTLFVKPYRRALLNVLCVGKVKAKLGLADTEVTTMTTKSGKRAVI